MTIEKSIMAISKQALQEASFALSQLTGQVITTNVLGITGEKTKAVPAVFPLEKNVVSVFVPIKGPSEGLAMLLLGPANAIALSDFLMPKVTRHQSAFSELHESALKEITNILIGNFLTVLGNELSIRVIGGPPQLVQGKCQDVFQNNLLNDKTRNIFAIKIAFITKDVNVEGFLVVLLEDEKIK